MKRILVVAFSSSAIALAAPGIASAHHHHAAKRHHHRHAARVHVLDFRASALPATSPTTAASPVAPTGGETVGTVTSFKEGKLTITLNDGTIVSGQVTERTEIRCTPATPPPETEDTDDQSGSGEGDHGSSGEAQSEHSAHQAARMASNGGDDEEAQQDTGNEQQSCTPATALVPTTPVREAELSIGPSGSVWDHVDVVH
jgi:hypothetical protein